MLRAFVVFCLLLSSPAFGAEICKPFPSKGIDRIDVFDGDPEDRALLAPDRGGDRWALWNLHDVYRAGRIVTIRCSYTDGSEVDVPLVQPVERCRYARRKERSQTIACR